jgi:hypothetical protein
MNGEVKIASRMPPERRASDASPRRRLGKERGSGRSRCSTAVS